MDALTGNTNITSINDKKSYTWRSQYHIKTPDIRYQTPKKKTKRTRTTKPGHTKIRPQRPNPGEPKEQLAQWTPRQMYRMTTLGNTSSSMTPWVIGTNSHRNSYLYHNHDLV